jgi:hypothetical protein
MNRVLAIAVTLAFVPLAGAQQLYKYIDKDGKTVYTDQPPPTAQAKPIASPPPPPTPSANSAPGNKSAVDRDKDAQKGRDQAKEAQKKQDEAAKKAAAAEERCNQARTALQQFTEGGRLMKYNEKGEREYMSDEEIANGRNAAARQMDEACKS